MLRAPTPPSSPRFGRFEAARRPSTSSSDFARRRPRAGRASRRPRIAPPAPRGATPDRGGDAPGHPDAAPRTTRAFRRLPPAPPANGVLALANRSDVPGSLSTRSDAPTRRSRSPRSCSSARATPTPAGSTARGRRSRSSTRAWTTPSRRMGGGSFPNAKVVAGADLGDDDDDPMDCLGHGTSVAGVAAGPRGVAPGARLVALKVAGTRDLRNGRRLRHPRRDRLGPRPP